MNDTTTTKPIGKRLLPIEPETRQLIDQIAPRLSLTRSGYLFGPNPTWAIRIALAYAKRVGMVPPLGVPMNGVSRIRVNTHGFYDYVLPERVSLVIKEAVRHYTREGMPTVGGGIASRRATWLSLPESMLAEIAVSAFASRRVSEVEAVDILEQAINRIVVTLPASGHEDVRRDVPLRIDGKLYEEFLERASTAGMDADTMLWQVARQILREREAR